MARLRILRQWTGLCDMTPDYSPLMGATEVDGFYVTAGWGTWGFKAIPAGGMSIAELVATGQGARQLIAPFASTASATTAPSPTAARQGRTDGIHARLPQLRPARSYHEFWFGGELRRLSPTASRSSGAIPQPGSGPTPPARSRSGGSTSRGCRRWLTVERDTRNNEVGPAPSR